MFLLERFDFKKSKYCCALNTSRIVDYLFFLQNYFSNTLGGIKIMVAMEIGSDKKKRYNDRYSNM